MNYHAHVGCTVPSYAAPFYIVCSSKKKGRITSKHVYSESSCLEENTHLLT